MFRFAQLAWRQFRAEISARPLGLRVVKWIMFAIAAIWITGVGWIEISGAPDDYGFRSASYRKATKRCGGSYASRYECKSSVIIAGQNKAFIDWTVRLAIIFTPPFGLVFVFGYIRRRREEQEAEAKRRRIRARRLTA